VVQLIPLSLCSYFELTLFKATNSADMLLYFLEAGDVYKFTYCTCSAKLFLHAAMVYKFCNIVGMIVFTV